MGEAGRLGRPGLGVSTAWAPACWRGRRADAASQGEPSPGTGARNSKKSRGVLHAPIALRYAFIREHAEMYPVGLMCRLLGVSRSGYHASRCRPVSPRDSADIALIARLHEIDAE